MFITFLIEVRSEWISCYDNALLAYFGALRLSHGSS